MSEIDGKLLCPRRSEIPGSFKIPEHDEWRDGQCSFCGSMSPADFLDVCELGGELGPTDKDYKVYVSTPEGEKKFFFQHLDEAGKRHFVELLNAKKLNIGYPGYFYVLPFFVVVITPPPIAKVKDDFISADQEVRLDSRELSKVKKE